jgi:tryptophan halogenase
MALCRLMPNSTGDYSSIAGLNKEIAVNWDSFRWFLGMHYKFNKQLDTPFWHFCNEHTNIGNAQMIIDLFNQRPPLSAGNFGTGSPYTALEALVFNSYSYDSLLFGQKLLTKPLAPPEMTKEEYLSKVQSYQVLTDKALTLYELLKITTLSRTDCWSISSPTMILGLSKRRPN